MPLEVVARDAVRDGEVVARAEGNLAEHRAGPAQTAGDLCTTPSPPTATTRSPWPTCPAVTSGGHAGRIAGPR